MLGPKLDLVTGEAVSDLSSCHMAFIPAGSDERVAQILQDLRGVGALTVGESKAFAEAGGIIRLYLDEQKIRFDVHIGRAAEERLKISS